MKQPLSFTSSDELDLKGYYSLPEQPPHSLVIIVHGIGEHSGRFNDLIDFLAQNGYATAGFDLRGHGESQGRRGHINRWSDYRNDLNRFVQQLPKAITSLPSFLYGHSLGALIVIDALISQDHPPFKGALLSGIPIESAAEKNAIKRNLAIILSNIWPTLQLKVGISRQQLSRDVNALSAHREDPLTHGWGTVRWAYETLQAIRRIRTQANEISLPLLVMHGSADPVAKEAGAKQLFDQFGSSDKTFISYPGALHEPHNDICSKQVFKDIISWFNRTYK